MPQQGGGPRRAERYSLELKRPDRAGEKQALICFKKVLIFKEGPWIKTQTQQYEYLQGQTQQSHTQESFPLALIGILPSFR